MFVHMCVCTHTNIRKQARSSLVFIGDKINVLLEKYFHENFSSIKLIMALPFKWTFFILSLGNLPAWKNILLNEFSVSRQTKFVRLTRRKQACN